MARIIEITDLSIPELAVYTHLTEARLRADRSRPEGLFIAESEKVISAALEAGLRPVSLLLERRQLERAAALLDRCGDIPAYTGDRELLAGLTGYALHRGFLCAMERPRRLSLPEVCQGKFRIVVLENITDPTNVGAIFRSAAGLGMDGVLTTPSCCDPLHRRAVRVSMGAVFQIPWTRIGDKNGDWPEPGLSRLKAMGFRTAAMALDGRSVPIDVLAPGTGPLAVILGNEGEGLCPETIAQCDMTLQIPMAHGVDSLNVAAAGAVAFWQLRRS